MLDIDAKLAALKEQSLWRECRVVDAVHEKKMQLGDKTLLNFCSNDYLGYSQHPYVIEQTQRAISQWGVGSGAAHLVCGHSREHEQLEEELAEFVGTESALLFSTGFMANTGVLSSLLTANDFILQDKLNHASLVDGARATSATLRRYQHNNMAHLRELLLNNPASMIATDSIFSMDGDCANLNELIHISREYQSFLYIDDAHGLGFLGAQGRGCLQQFQLQHQPDIIYMGTLGKALGGFGAFIAAPKKIIDFLRNSTRSYMYTTALPPALAAATRASLHLLKNNDGAHSQLHKNIAYFKEKIQHTSLKFLNSDSAIQPLLLESNERALRWSHSLYEQGFWVSAIRPPTVPVNQARLRITLSASHSLKNIDDLIHALLLCQQQEAT